jgi:hypothetical protein
MTEWALEKSLGALLQCNLSEAIDRRSRRAPDLLMARPRRCNVILAGNIFSACLQPFAFALALGIPVLCKAASDQATFPSLFATALAQADPAVGAALGVTTFPSASSDHLSALLEGADLVICYGGDDTILALRRQLGATTRLIEHGHGVSVAYLGRDALTDPQIIARLAIDVAAYDQRGCLSPQLVWINDDNDQAARQTFLQQLHQALDRLDADLPRGPLPPEIAAAQMQWRGVAAIEGELLQGAGHAVASNEQGRLRPGPGWRNLLVLGCEGPRHLKPALARFGPHLKQIGIACGDDERAELLDALDPVLCPRICRLGEMQSPPFDAYSEGADPIDGFVRWVQVAS